mgnify:CR=1 FL=1
MLLAAKDAAPHGTWLPFLDRAGVPERKAQRLMTLARSGLKSDTVSDLGGVSRALEFVKKQEKADKNLLALKCLDWPHILELATDFDDFKKLTEEMSVELLEHDLPLLGEAISNLWEAFGMFDSTDQEAKYAAL